MEWMKERERENLFFLCIGFHCGATYHATTPLYPSSPSYSLSPALGASEKPVCVWVGVGERELSPNAALQGNTGGWGRRGREKVAGCLNVARREKEGIWGPDCVEMGAN